MRSTKITDTTVLSILFLFFLQSLSDFIEAIYAFGLLVTAFTIEVASIILLFSPFLLLFFRRPPSRSIVLGLAYLAILARLLEPMLNPSGKLVASGISVGAFLLLFPILLQTRQLVQGWAVANALAIAVSLSICFRTANSSLDLSESCFFQLISWLLGLVTAGLLWRTELLSPQQASSPRATSRARIAVLSLGLASVILMIYFAFASPTVIARWTAVPYALVLFILLVAFTVFGWMWNAGSFSRRLTKRSLLVWNLLFVLFLVLTILPHQIMFPSNPDAYPLDAPLPSPPAVIFLTLMLALSPVLFIDFMLFARQISFEKPSLPQIGTSFVLAALFFLIMVFFHAFTTIYDYAPVIGPVFRDRFWLVYLLAGLGLIVPEFALRAEEFPLKKPDAANPFPPLAVGVLAVLSLAAVYINSARPTSLQDNTNLKVMTYNIQQGYDVEGNKNVEGQLAVIKAVDPDILGLQESDTARVANGNADAVRYFADHLDFFSYYGPTTTTGTFGIALLSRYPIQNPRTFFMFSEGEQTAAIQAEISIDGKIYQVFVTHLGNSGPMIQLENVLARVAELENVILMGDFNFRPTTEQYSRVSQTLFDSWLLKWPAGKVTPGVDADRRIDYIFVSPGTTVLESGYVSDPASDHPYLVTVIEP